MAKRRPGSATFLDSASRSWQHQQAREGLATASPHSREPPLNRTRMQSANVPGELPPYEVIAPREQLLPIVFNSPHSGSFYPREFLALTRLDEHAIRRSEDSFVDELVAPSVGLGVPLLRANFPRAFVDVNR